MRITPAGLLLLQSFEGCELTAYPDSGGLPTIGWGTVRYPDGHRVALGDTCTAPEAAAWLRFEVAATEQAVDDLTVDTLTGNQFDALVCFTYNVGVGAFRGSTLRRLVNLNPNDPAIRHEFAKWCHVHGEFVQGLLNRRLREAAVYFGEVAP